MRLVSWDGGGQKGVFGARVIERIEESLPGFCSSIDMLAGTSAGSINAGARAIGLEPKEVTRLFSSLGKEVFIPRDFVDRVSGKLDEAVRANYDLHRVVELLVREFGADVRLCDLPKKFLAPTFDLYTWKPKYLDETDELWHLWQACAASSAAPTFFQSFEGPDGHHYVDGGMVDNSPSASAVDRAVKLGAATHEVRCLSIGTGKVARSELGGDWGLGQWLKGNRLLNVLFDGMAPVADYSCAQSLGRFDPSAPDHDPEGRYVRIDVSLPDGLEMDDPSRVPDLIAAADAVDLSHVFGWIERTWA